MNDGRVRLVRQVQQVFLHRASSAMLEGEGIDPALIHVLAERIQRLHAREKRFAAVRLSKHVAALREDNFEVTSEGFRSPRRGDRILTFANE